MGEVTRTPIDAKIIFLRGRKVMFSHDLAELYGVTTFNLNKAVKRNLDRFPEDFMFKLSAEEAKNLIFQFGISSWGGHRVVPFAFTEQGVAMLSSVLRSKRAIRVNIEIMRAFARLKEVLSTHKELSRKLEELEKKIGTHDVQIKAVFDVIRQLMREPEKPKRRIGFLAEEARLSRQTR